MYDNFRIYVYSFLREKNNFRIYRNYQEFLVCQIFKFKKKTIAFIVILKNEKCSDDLINMWNDCLIL